MEGLLKRAETESTAMANKKSKQKQTEKQEDTGKTSGRHMPPGTCISANTQQQLRVGVRLCHTPSSMRASWRRAEPSGPQEGETVMAAVSTQQHQQF